MTSRRRFLGAAAALAALSDPSAGEASTRAPDEPRDRDPLADSDINVSASVLDREVALEIDGGGPTVYLTFTPEVAAALADELDGWSTYVRGDRWAEFNRRDA